MEATVIRATTSSSSHRLLRMDRLEIANISQDPNRGGMKSMRLGVLGLSVPLFLSLTLSVLANQSELRRQSDAAFYRGVESLSRPGS